MSSKKYFLAGFVLIFLTSLIYLHQKVQIYVEAYRLSKNYQTLNDCIDKRDYLMYNLMKQVSISKLNDWMEKNEFSSIEKGKVLALRVEKKNTPARKSNLVALFNGLIRLPSGSSTALAKDRD